MSLLVEPAATELIGADSTFCSGLFEALRPGLGHPYKQLREEVGRCLFLIVRGLGGRQGDGADSAAARIDAWLGEEAVRLVVALREDNAADRREREASRSRHVLEATGVCLVLIHTALGRLAMECFGGATPRCFEFLLAASAHDDIELRALASHALLLCSCSPTAPPRGLLGSTADRPQWLGRMSAVAEVARLLRNREAPLPHKELEKALGLAVRPLLLCNLFLLNADLGAPENGDAVVVAPRAGEGLGVKLAEELRGLIEGSLGHSNYEVRQAARSTFAALVTIDAKDNWQAHLKKYVAMAGPPAL